MKVYMEKPLALKVAGVLAQQNNHELKALGRHIERAAHVENRFLTFEEATAVVSALCGWLERWEPGALSTETLQIIRLVKSALPKLRALRDNQARRPADQPPTSEATNEN